MPFGWVEILCIGIVIGLLLSITARWIGGKLGRQQGEPVLVVCAWCGKEISRNGIDGELIVTHGICPDCQQKHFANTLGQKQNGR